MLRRALPSSIVPGPCIRPSSRPLTANTESRSASPSSRRGVRLTNNWLSGSAAAFATSAAVFCWYVPLVNNSRCIAFSRHPPLTNSPASHSSNSGCVGLAPAFPKSFGVATSPAPMWCCHSRFTITRAACAPPPASTSVIQFAMARRLPEYFASFGGSTRHRFPRSGPRINTCKKSCSATPFFKSVFPRRRKCVSLKKSAPCVFIRSAGYPSAHTSALASPVGLPFSCAPSFAAISRHPLSRRFHQPNSFPRSSAVSPAANPASFRRPNSAATPASAASPSSVGSPPANTDSLGRPMLCRVFTLNSSSTLKIPAAANGSANVKTAAWFLLNCGSTAHPVPSFSSRLPWIDKFPLFCSNVAAAFAIATSCVPPPPDPTA